MDTKKASGLGAIVAIDHLYYGSYFVHDLKDDSHLSRQFGHSINAKPIYATEKLWWAPLVQIASRAKAACWFALRVDLGLE
ncbi:hypothetical protein [Rhizobium sp. NPDC090279]|uniref:hypothetical protein n=1 Tax=Rhizobium sp. NPDC090279 TaxID=3364499 RepID=UPI00383A3D2C